MENSKHSPFDCRLLLQYQTIMISELNSGSSGIKGTDQGIGQIVSKNED